MEKETVEYIVKTYTEVDDTVINAKPKVTKCMNINLVSRKPISITKGDVLYMFNPKTLYYNDITENAEFFINIDGIDSICIFDNFEGATQNLRDMFSKILGGK